MSNPLFNTLPKNQVPNNDFFNFLNEVKRFQQTFKGNPQEEVQKMLNNGQLSQSQFNQFAQIANQIMATFMK